jgi:hypothetical protein
MRLGGRCRQSSWLKSSSLHFSAQKFARNRCIQRISLLTLLSTVHKLTTVHSFGSDEHLGSQPVLVWVPELNGGQWSPTSRVVDNLLDDTLVHGQKYQSPHFLVQTSCPLFLGGLRPPATIPTPLVPDLTCRLPKRSYLEVSVTL